MNKKGVSNISLGIILMVFIGIIVALALYTGGIAPAVGVSTTIPSMVGNQTVTAGASGACVELANGQRAISGYQLNATNNSYVISGNFTYNQRIGADGLIASALCTIAIAGNTYANSSVNVSYTYEPDGYMSDSGSRSIFAIIAVFVALAIAVIALYPTLKVAVDNWM